MTDRQCDRLKSARLRAGFDQAKKAAETFGWNINTYKSHENGNRGLSQKAAELYGPAFNVPVGWLLTGENPPEWFNFASFARMRPLRRVPVISELNTLNPDKLPYYCLENDVFSCAIDIDPSLGESAFDITLEDESMAPDFRAGEQVTVNPDASCAPGDYVIAVKNNNAMFRRLSISGYDADGNSVESLVPTDNAWPIQQIDENTWIVGKAVKHIRNIGA